MPVNYNWSLYWDIGEDRREEKEEGRMLRRLN